MVVWRMVSLQSGSMYLFYFSSGIIISWFSHFALIYHIAHFPPKVLAELKELREGLLISEDDSINWRDFIALMMDQNVAMNEDNLRAVFEHFKSSHQDYLTLSDIVNVVGGTEQQAMDILKMVDANSDGKIDFDEFKKMMATQA